jgi:hypothetical protein
LGKLLLFLLILWHVVVVVGLVTKDIFVLRSFFLALMADMQLLCRDDLKRPLSNPVVWFDVDILFVLVSPREMSLKKEAINKS